MQQNPLYVRRVVLEGYKSIRRAETTFEPGLNIIIGDNGSGKTNFLEFLHIALKTFPEVQEPYRMEIELAEQAKKKYEWQIETTTPSGEREIHPFFIPSYLEKSRQEIINYFNTTATNELLRWLEAYSPVKDIQLKETLAVTLHDREPVLENVQLEFFINGIWQEWDWLSTTLKRMLLLMAELSCCRFASSIFLIDQPEWGVHPHQLHLLMLFLREQAQEKQIILTTHSPQVLDILNRDELHRLIIAEMTGEGTKLKHLDKKKIKKAQFYMKNKAFLSDYWRYSDLEEREEI